MNKKQNIVPNVVRGGIAIPLGRNYYYMKGRKHKNGGIDIGENPKTGIEVEDGEVMHVAKNEVKVFSAQPFLNGESPAKKVMGGEDPNKIFKQQEDYKDRNHLNDDGTKKGRSNKAQMGTKKESTNPIFNPFTKSWHRVNKGNEIYLPSTIKYKKPFGYTMYSKDGFAINYNEDGKEINRRKGTQTPSITGKSRNVREQKYFDIDTEYTDSVKVISKRYGLNPNLVASRLAREGIDGNIERYNVSGGKALITNDYHVNNISGKYWGLDDFYSNIKDEKTKLIEPWVGFYDDSFINEKGRKTETAVFNKWSDIISATAAELKGRRDRLKKSYPNISKEQLDALTSGSFNLGEQGVKNHIRKHGVQSVYNKYKPFIELKDNNKITNKENAKTNKKKFGGEDKINTNKMYSVTSNGKTNWYSVPSTGERTKARYGLTEDEESLIINRNKPQYSYLDVTKEDVDAPKPKPTTIKVNDIVGDNEKYITSNNNSKYSLKDYWTDNKENITLNGIGLASNLIGNLISYGVTSRAINKMQAPIKPTTPIQKRANKLKTKININPQLSKMTEGVSAYERNVDNNTASSQVALARKQRARNNAILMANELYADKENKETELINKDRLNQQTVANDNVDSYNAYLDKLNQYENAKVAFENDRIAKRLENKINTVNNVNAAIQNVIGNLLRSRSENQTKTASILANPNVPAEILYEQGLISKKTYDAYRKAYKLKKKNNQD